MRLIQVAAGVLNQTPLDWDNNKNNILAAIDEAKREGVSLLCLPELCITGYGCEDAFHSPHMQRTAWQVLQEIVPSTQGIVVSVGLPIFHGQALYNCACLIADGRILGFTAKRYLAGDGIHYEPRWFKPWPLKQQTVLERDGQQWPFGDIYFDVGGIKIGFEICEDAWVASRPGSELAARGVDVILNPSASHFAFGKTKIRERFVLEGSRAFGVSYVYANLLGNEAGRAVYDGGALIASSGKMLAMGPRFSFRNHGITKATIDIDATSMARAQLASFMPTLQAERTSVVLGDFAYPTLLPKPSAVEQAAWETGERVKEEEFTRAVALALFDYMRKSRSHGFVVSLSGGADSAGCACLVAMMVRLAANELGLKELRDKLGYLSWLATLEKPEAIVGRLLTCVYQATRNSGPVTRGAAQQVAAAISADYLEFDVDPIVQQYMQTVSQAIGRELGWKTDDVALQNIQARVRSPGVWMLANLRNALLLATSNRSEAAVGYTTMDGDTSGGLSPIGGIDKAFLRAWLRWLETEGPEGLGPIPALDAVNHQQPTAELRPADNKQTDESDLMPYPLLDAIERSAIRDRCSPLEVYQLMHAQFPQYESRQLLAWVERFFLLWCRNQWKRERYAPSFHLDDENLDPKTWCRFPILSGNFERELKILRAYV